jgi:hypothetical protein
MNVTTGFWEVYKVTCGSSICVTFVILAIQFSYFIKSPVLPVCCNICTVVNTSFSAVIETGSLCGQIRNSFVWWQKQIEFMKQWVWETVRWHIVSRAMAVFSENLVCKFFVTGCLMLEVRGRKGRNGSIVLKVWQLSYSVWHYQVSSHALLYGWDCNKVVWGAQEKHRIKTVDIQQSTRK